MLMELLVGARLLAEPRDLSAELEEIRSAADLSSMVCAVYQRGELVATGAAGWLSMEHPTPVTVDSKYHIGSCTKAMTAAMIGMLVERGELAWDTPVAVALAGVTDQIHPAFAELTVRDLLAHRAGIAEGRIPGLNTMPWVLASSERALPLRGQRRAIAEGLLRAGPQIEGGKDGSFAYSNFGYILAGVIIEERLNQSWEDAAQELIFGPLGMSSAGFGPPGELGAVTQPLGHTRRDEWMPLELVEGQSLPDNPASFGPAGTVHASIADWGKFVSDFEQGLEGKGKLLKQETYEAIATDPESDGYALGWGVTERPWAGGLAFSHAGSNTYWYAVTWVAPERDLAMVVASNMPPQAASAACDAMIGKMVEAFTQPLTPEPEPQEAESTEEPG